MQSVQEHLDKEQKLFNHSKSVTFPDGLPAFEAVKEFVLISNEGEAPFMWLQAVSQVNLAFIVIDPFLIYPGYRPDVCDEDVESLKLKSPNDVLLLSIVNIKNQDGHGITCNLVGPIVVNTKERLGKQVILKNHLDYSVRFRIEEQSGS